MATKPPERYLKIKEQFPEIVDAYEKLGKATHQGPLEHKYVHLIKLAVSAAVRSEGAVHSHTRKALEVGATPEEIRHAIVLLANTIGFPGMMAALSWVDDILEK
ncbi:MAG: carboxymuconolactone decarboxylase family protein [Cyclobacteriaceae bacterium]|nr:carboxymuconolactone decarboxylase family protein [Cyclobacteriaceae bacterium]